MFEFKPCFSHNIFLFRRLLRFSPRLESITLRLDNFNDDLEWLNNWSAGFFILVTGLHGLLQKDINTLEAFLKRCPNLRSFRSVVTSLNLPFLRNCYELLKKLGKLNCWEILEVQSVWPRDDLLLEEFNRTFQPTECRPALILSSAGSELDWN